MEIVTENFPSNFSFSWNFFFKSSTLHILFFSLGNSEKAMIPVVGMSVMFFRGKLPGEGKNFNVM